MTGPQRFDASGVSKDQIILVDIDGTVADNNHRSPFDWDAVDGDTPIPAAISMVQALVAVGYLVVFTTGRMEQCREATVTWLRKHVWDGLAMNNVIMRKDGDYRPDTIVKSEMYDDHIKGRYDVLLVIDDRKSVVKMWREEKGLAVMQGAEGDF